MDVSTVGLCVIQQARCWLPDVHAVSFPHRVGGSGEVWQDRPQQIYDGGSSVVAFSWFVRLVYWIRKEDSLP